MRIPSVCARRIIARLSWRASRRRKIRHRVRDESARKLRRGCSREIGETERKLIVRPGCEACRETHRKRWRSRFPLSLSPSLSLSVYLSRSPLAPPRDPTNLDVVCDLRLAYLHSPKVKEHIFLFFFSFFNSRKWGLFYIADFLLLGFCIETNFFFQYCPLSSTFS